MARDELHKTLRGTGISQGDLEARGWIRVVGTQVNVIPIEERFQYFTAPGRNRKVLKTDLDQAHFLIGAATSRQRRGCFRRTQPGNLPDQEVGGPILDWYAQTDPDVDIRQAAKLALGLVSHWRSQAGEEAGSSGR